ncbi:hypothetical protein, partial [Tepidimonas sp.]|uniref:hypothetical protein n=1 Tax=Tepidimonas sp. TaxID=2002775 RepID=UPI00391D4AD3
MSSLNPRHASALQLTADSLTPPHHLAHINNNIINTTDSTASSTAPSRTPLSLDAPVWNVLTSSVSLRLDAWRRLQGTAQHQLHQVIDWFTFGFPVPFHQLPPPFTTISRPVT